MKVSASPDRDLGRRVALVMLEIAVNCNLLDAYLRLQPPRSARGKMRLASDCGYLLVELYVDQMRLRPIRLPVGLHVVVPQLLNSVTRFCSTKSPYCITPNLALLARVLPTRPAVQLTRPDLSECNATRVLGTPSLCRDSSYDVLCAKGIDLDLIFLCSGIESSIR